MQVLSKCLICAYICSTDFSGNISHTYSRRPGMSDVSLRKNGTLVSLPRIYQKDNAATNPIENIPIIFTPKIIIVLELLIIRYSGILIRNYLVYSFFVCV